MVRAGDRREFGEISKLASGRFQARYADPAGRTTGSGSRLRHTAPHTFVTRGDAEAWLVDERRLLSNGTWTAPATRNAERRSASLQFGEYAQRWLAADLGSAVRGRPRLRSARPTSAPQCAADLGSAVRVDVREHDGTVFTDIITPPTDPSAAAEKQPAPTSPAGVLTRVGFAPHQPVAVAVVVAHQAADDSGTVRLTLPPSHVATYGDKIVVVPETVASSEGAA